MADHIPNPTATAPLKAPGIAVAALVLGLLSFIFSILTGYLSIAGLFILPVLAGLFVPVFARVQENGRIDMVINDAHQVSLAIELYKEKNGTFPETLQQLVDGQFLNSNAPLSAASYPNLTFDGGASDGQLFHYFKPAPDDDRDTVILISDCSFPSTGDSVRRVFGFMDRSVSTDIAPAGPVRE